MSVIPERPGVGCAAEVSHAIAYRPNLGADDVRIAKKAQPIRAAL